jgi:uncharacterized membrane protein
VNGASTPFPYAPGSRGGFFVPEHSAAAAAHPLEWAIFAIVLALLLFAVAKVALAAFGGRRPPRPASAGVAAGATPSLEVLSSRYAHGEIGRDEFLRAVDDVRGQAAPAADDEPTAEQPPS